MRHRDFTVRQEFEPEFAYYLLPRLALGYRHGSDRLTATLDTIAYSRLLHAPQKHMRTYRTIIELLSTTSDSASDLMDLYSARTRLFV